MTNYSAFHWSEKARKYAETVGTIFNVKGRVNTVADLPISGNKVGDLYLVGLSTDADLTEYAWLSFDNVTRWEKLGSTATSLAFSALTGSPNDNVALKNALDGKYSTSNPDGYISGITSDMVTTALGYTPYNSSNPSGYISGITSAMVTTALGYTPQQQLVSGTNIKTINNNSILGSGNLTLDGLPSQTGQNGKFLTTNGTSASWSVPKTFNLLDFKWTDHIINDMSWVRADTFSWLDGTIYQSVYELLLEEFSNGETHTDTIGGITVDYRLSPNGFKIVNGKSSDDVSAVEQLYNQTGVAWYYILHREAFRFKLPRSTYNKYSKELPVRGDGMSIGLTNGSVSFGITWNSSLGISGANASYNNTVGTVVSNTITGLQNTQCLGITTDQTKSGIVASSISDDNMYLYFYVGQFTQTATEQTAGLNAELFNNKVDLNAANLSTAGKSLISGLGMPKSTGTQLTWGATGTTYTAPSNGWFSAYATGAAGSNVFVELQNTSTPVEIVGGHHFWYAAGGSARIFCPAKVGDVVRLNYNGSFTLNVLYFIPSVGEE